MYKKRIMAIVISAIMMFSIFSTTVFAEETSVDSWDGTAEHHGIKTVFQSFI